MPDKLDPEQERLVRLREKQLSYRDPDIKKRKFSNMISEKERRTKKTLSPARMWSVIPHIWKCGFYGLVLGLLTFAVLPELWASENATIVAIVVAAVMVILGILIGNALDYRDNIKDLSS